MNPILHPKKARLFAIGLAASALALATTSQASLNIPYTPDGSTLHLWHLNGSDSLTTLDEVIASPITLTNLGWPIPGTLPYTNASLGNPSFTGLGECMSGINKGHVLYGGSFPDVSQFCNPQSGAFTFEALVKFDTDPLGTIDAEILCGDNSDGVPTRGWLWRIYNGQMEWNLLAGAAGDNDFKVNLPATGANAAIAGAWYHAAVTYSGYSPTNGDTANILTFYWTLVDANRTNADPLASFTATRPLDGSPLGTSQPNLGIGGSARNISNIAEGIIGSVDEARVSNVARRTSEMAFVPCIPKLRVPYTADASTLHLWHLNGSDSLTTPDEVIASPITLTNLGWPTPGTLPYTNASLGNPSFTGLGECMSGINKGHVLYGGSFPDVSQFCNPQSGAFTFEALVKFDTDPLGTIDAEILCGDNSDGVPTRGWLWRIYNGQMEWNLLAGAAGDNDFKVNLPATGANAAIAGAWYHAAVTYSGYSPTNGDTANILTFYWTLVDANRAGADVLASFTATRPLDGSPLGTSQPNLGIGGSARNISNIAEGIIGSVDEARVSNVARQTNDLAFKVSGCGNAPVIYPQPPATTLSGYGQTLIVGAGASGTAPLYYQWKHAGTNVPGQTQTTLIISNATFANAGSYQLVVTNAYGRDTSTADQVTIGAVATGLGNTGLDTNGAVSAGDIVDPRWTLYQSADPTFLGPDTLVFEVNYPLEKFDPNGSFSPADGISMWTSVAGNAGGVPMFSPAGQYIYRATFLLDDAQPNTMTMNGRLSVNGVISDILVNGKSSGISVTPLGNSPLYWGTYAITNGFVAGVNTLDFVETLGGSGIAGLRVEINSLGQALPAGLPVITNQPQDQIVRDASAGPGSKAVFPVVALGRPPLTYQWWADGAPISGATKRTLTFENPTAGAQGTHFSVVVANDSGSVTSRVATLTLVPSNQPPAAVSYNVAVFQGQTAIIPLSRLVQDSTDPDHDPVSYGSADGTSTHGGSVSQVGASLVYSPVAGYIGADAFGYTVTDSGSASGQGYVTILSLAAPAPLMTVLVGGTANLNAGVATVPPGYSFQWQLYGTNLPGATSAQLVITNAQSANAGPYCLVVTDGTGQVITSPFSRVALNGAPMPRFNVNPLNWVVNGYGTAASLAGYGLTLTDGVGGETRSAWFGWPQDISSFTASFVYLDAGGAGADGFAFVLQNSAAGTAALGAGGGGLAYRNIDTSVAFEFNIYNPNTSGIALQSGGTVSPPFTPTDPVNLASGNPIKVDVSYSAGIAQLTLTDLTTALSTNITFDVVSLLGGTFESILGTNIALVGFTGADGGVVSTQTISNFVFRPPSLSLSARRTASNTLLLSWTPSYPGFVLQSSANLGGAWQDVTTPVTAAGAQYQVTTPLSAAARFYRLILP